MGLQICFHQNLWILVKIWWHFFKLRFEMVFSISFLQKSWFFFYSVLLQTSTIKPNSFQVDRHLNCDCHDLALKWQGLEANVTAAPGNKRLCSSTTIDEVINNNSEKYTSAWWELLGIWLIHLQCLIVTFQFLWNVSVKMEFA